jgi:hypothetical protein
MDEPESDWLGELRWRGYPRVEDEDPPAREPRRAPVADESRAEQLAGENTALRARVAALTRLAAEFERRLADAAAACEAADLEAQERLREAQLAASAARREASERPAAAVPASEEEVRLLRQELRDLLAKFSRLAESFGQKP